MYNDLIYYSNIPFLYKDSKILETIPGGINFSKISKFFHPNVGIVDRTETYKIPFVHKKIPIPKFNPSFNLTYEDCAMEKMKELDEIYNNSGKKFRLLYSGGIDSTAILASFVEYFGLEKTSKILEIACSKESIEENPWAWDRIIRKSKFKLYPSHNHTNMWDDDFVFLMGEGNDQLFNHSLFSHYKNGNNLYNPVTVEEVVEFLNKIKPSNDANYTANILINISKKSPIPVENMSMFFWWTMFNLSWSAVGYRVLSQSRRTKFNQDFFTTSFKQFFQTDLFQQWSLKYHYDNPENFANISDYKLECKKLSIKILKIPEYYSKNKHKSFPMIHTMRPSGCIIDSNFDVKHDILNFLDYLEPNNSFI
jgi:hypothetical protein